MTCPCGSGKPFEQCCGPYLAGAPAPTAEALMRSRYTAYTRSEIDYLMATQDPSTRRETDRAATERWARESTWLGLQIVSTRAGGPADHEGTVEFKARYRTGDQESTHHELSTFHRHDGRWFFVEGSAPRGEPVKREQRVSPNAPCPCGSGMKFKRCHGRAS